MDEYKYGEKVYASFYGYKFRDPKQAFYYRCNPVPGIHKYGHGGWFRNPKTKQERTGAYIPEIDECENLTVHQINKLKKIRKLPSDYDDIPRSRKGDSWKNYRLTRYKTR